MRTFLINFFLINILATSIFAAQVNINEKLGNFTLPDQFNKIHTVDQNVHTIIVSFEKDTGKMVNEFLASKESNFLRTHHAVFIANISGMPSIITKLFALPKMQDYKHNILLIYDDNDDRFLQKDEFTTVYTVEKGIVKSIKFVKNKKDLEKII